MTNLRKLPSDLDNYSELSLLHVRNETLFFKVLVEHLAELMPIVYTPIVGLASQRFGHIYKAPIGLYVTIEDRGHVGEIISNWPMEDVRVDYLFGFTCLCSFCCLTSYLLCSVLWSPMERGFSGWATWEPMAWPFQWGSWRCTPLVEVSIPATACPSPCKPVAALIVTNRAVNVDMD